MTQATHELHTVKALVLYMAMELSKKTWKLAFGVGGQKHRIVNVEAGQLGQLGKAIQDAKQKFGLPDGTPVRSCYEAGRDGFWIHRAIEKLGIDNVIVDPASIEVNRRGRRAKNDRIDAKKLLKRLTQYHEGDEDCWSVVRVPSIEDEDERRPHRELERLKKERTGHRNRIQALLFAHGLRLKPGRLFINNLETVRLYDGSSIPAKLKDEAIREYKRLQLVDQQIRDLEKEQKASLAVPTNVSDAKAAQLAMLKGIGPTAAVVLSKELFGWRVFGNRKEVASLVGLTPTPFDSGDSDREQGISKSGSRRVRSLMVEIAWCWQLWQPESKLTRWYKARYGAGTKRSRRVGLVALARKLLVALWKYVERGELPEGAVIMTA